MFRSVLVIILVIAILWIARVLLQRIQPRTEPRRSQTKDMVQCEQCRTYIPGDDAITKDGHYFCSRQHLEEWKHRD